MRLTPKRKEHTALIQRAQEVYGNTIRFAVYCIAHNYTDTTLKQVRVLREELEKDALRRG